MELISVVEHPSGATGQPMQDESVSMLLSSCSEDLAVRRLAKLNLIRVFGCDESSIGTEFLEPQTPLAEQSPRRFKSEDEHENEAQWIRSIVFSGNPARNPVPPVYAAAEDIVDCVPMVQTSNSDYRFMLHQEASYRRFVIQQYDNEFSLIFEKYWDSQDRHRFALHESVARYWLVSDYEQGANSIFALADDDILRIKLMENVAVLGQHEAATRQGVVEEFLAGMDEFDKEEARDYLRAMSKKESRSASPSTEPLNMSSTHPPETPPSPPTPPVCAKPPPQRTGANHRHAQQQRIMAEYLQGHLVAQTTPPKSAAPASPTQQAVNEHHGAFVMCFSTPASVINFVLGQETERRHRIAQSFHSEQRLMAQRLAKYTVFVRKGLAQQEIFVRETVERSNVESEYFYMMMEACTTLEKLRRRDILIKQQPRSFSSFKYEEKQEWLQARKAESDRFTQEELNGIERDKAMREALVTWSETRLEEKLALNRSETSARLAVMHDESSQFAVIREFFEDKMGILQAIQSAYEIELERVATTVTWTKETYDAVYLREAQHRTSLEADEKDAFRRLQAAETSCYLANRRNWLVDQTVADQLAPYDQFESELRSKLGEACQTPA